MTELLPKAQRAMKRKRNLAAKSLREKQFRPKVVNPKKLEKPKKITLRNYEDIE